MGWELAKVLRQSELPLEELYFEKMAPLEDTTLQRILSADFLAAFRSSIPSQFPADVLSVLRSDAPLVNKVGYADFRFRLLNDMLVKVDRMSMANSLEVRSPFLDHKLVEFAALLPVDLKFRNWQGKYLLRKTVKPFLPQENLAKSKRGFSVPLRKWFKTGLRELIGDYLSLNNGLAANGVMDKQGVQALLREHKEGKQDHSSAIWILLMCAVWMEQHQK